MVKDDISAEELRKLLRYEPETGRLFWLPRPVGMFKAKGETWNARFAGKEAFTAIQQDGYKIGKVFGRVLLAHRVIWALVTGEWPKNELDHRNRQGSDNRWANLREATRSENSRNTGVRSDSISGIKGVRWNKSANKWVAEIKANGDRIYLGCFDTPEEAGASYDAAAKRHHGDFARTA